MIKQFFLAIILPALLFANVIDEYATYDSYIEQLQKDIKKQTEDLKNIKDSKENLSKKIQIIQNKIIAQEETVKLSSIKIRKLKQQVEQIEDKIDLLNKDIKKLTKQINKSNIYLIDNKGITSIKVLLFSKDFYTLIKNIELIERLNTNILNKVEEINRKKDEIVSLKEELDLKYAALKRVLALKRSTLVDLKNEKIKFSQLVKILQEDEENKKEYIKILEEKYKELQGKIKKIEPEMQKEGGKELTNSSFYKSKGKLPWPVSGKVIEHFGPKKLDDFSGEIFVKGIKIQVNDEGYVKSIFDGTIKYIDWVRGYGNIVIVKHDKFFYTLYANLDEVFVTIGQEVKKNDKLGLIDVDVKGISPYLYFEIRKQDTAVNPENWLATNGGNK